MKPIEFHEHNVVYAKNQKEYLPLPAFKSEEETISCWKLTRRERWAIFFGKNLWLRQMNFGAPLQPQLPTIEDPFNGTPRIVYNMEMKGQEWTKKVRKYDVIRDGVEQLIVIDRFYTYMDGEYGKVRCLNVDVKRKKQYLSFWQRVAYTLKFYRTTFYPL